MPSQSDVARLRAANVALVDRVQRDLEAFWASLDLNRPERVRDELLRFVPVLTTAYGDAAAVVAADWYDELRASEGVEGRFSALMAESFPVEAVEARVRYGASHLFTENPDDTRSFLTTALSSYVLQPGRDSISRSVRLDPARPGWARVPSGPDTCAFCLVLASRGAVYETETTAGGDMHKYHGRCDCTATPIWPGQEYPEGYDPDDLYQKYEEARQEATTNTLKGHDSEEVSILQALRRQQGIR